VIRLGSALAAWGVVAGVAALGVVGIVFAGGSYMRAIGEWESDGRPRVVASTTIIAQLADEVGAGRVGVHALLHPDQDPHTYEPVPRDGLAFERADLILLNGYDLDFWAERLAASGGRANRPVVRVAEEVRTDPLPWPGDDTMVDPHLWMDPLLTIGFVEVIRDALISIDPDGAEDYRHSAAALIARLEELDGWIAAEIERIPAERRLLVTTHDAYRYFGRRYGIHILDTIWGISTEEEPSAFEIARLFRNLQDYRVPAFVETTINPQLMREIAGQAGVRLGGELYADALGTPGSGAETYIGMMQHNVRTIVTALGPAARH
jgi:manganese/iron transport system substrate-binding protein